MRYIAAFKYTKRRNDAVIIPKSECKRPLCFGFIRPKVNKKARADTGKYTKYLMRYPKKGRIKTVCLRNIFNPPLPPKSPCMIAESAASASGASEPIKIPAIDRNKTAGSPDRRRTGDKIAAERRL